MQAGPSPCPWAHADHHPPCTPPTPDPLPTPRQAGARICKALGQDFLPYLALVMPPLLAAAQLKPDVVVRDSLDEGGDEEDDDEVGAA